MIFQAFKQNLNFKIQMLVALGFRHIAEGSDANILDVSKYLSKIDRNIKIKAI